MLLSLAVDKNRLNKGLKAMVLISNIYSNYYYIFHGHEVPKVNDILHLILYPK